MELLFEFLTMELRLDSKAVAEILWRDYQRGGRRDKPAFLKAFLPERKPSRFASPSPACPNVKPGIWFDSCCSGLKKSVQTYTELLSNRYEFPFIRPADTFPIGGEGWVEGAFVAI